MDYHIRAQYRPVPMDFRCWVEAAEVFDVAGTQQVISVTREGFCLSGQDIENLKTEAEFAVQEKLKGLIEIRDLVKEWGGTIEILK